MEGWAPASIINPEDLTIQEKLVVEVLEEIEQKLDSWLNTYGKGPLSIEEMLSFLSIPDDVPKDPEMVEGILKYINQVKTNPKEFTKKLFEQEGTALNELLKNVEQDQPLKGQLNESQWQQAEKVITKEAVNHGLFNWFTELPYKERAAKVLKEHLENQGIYDEVWISESNKTKIQTKLLLSADATLEQEIDLTNVPEDELFKLLVLTYKVPYWEAYDAELNGWDRVVNWLRIQDDKIARKEGWAVAYANFTADVVNAPAGAVQGWITGEHWRTGQELVWWEHILGIVDVIPGEALAKAGVTALVIKIGDKVFDLTKVTSATRNFILASKSAGLKLVVKSTNEIILYSAKGTKEIGRFLNGILQDIYWVYGGDKVLAKLAGIQYIVDGKTLNNAIEIVEDGAGRIGARVVGVGVKIADDLDGLIIKLKRKAKYVTEGTGEYSKVKGHHPTAKKAFEGDVAYDYKKAFSVSIKSLEEAWKTINRGIPQNVHAAVTGQQNSLYSAFAKTGNKLGIDEMAEIEIKAMVNAGIPEDIATGWIVKALEDLKGQGVTVITNIPWNGLN